jgi:hypothetical protein
MSLRVFGALGILALLVIGAFGMGTMIYDEDGDPYICTSCWFGGHHHHASEVAPWRLIHRVGRAQAHYYTTDPDGKGRKEYWKKDIAGLWSNPDKSGQQMGLIFLGDAGADAQPVIDLTRWTVPEPYSGYRIRALLQENEPIPATDRYAACLFPVTANAGKWTYILNEAGVIYRKELGQAGGLPVYPRDPLGSGWKKFRQVRF